MPYFTATQIMYQAKQGVVNDGEVITVGSDGYTVTSTLSSYSAFSSNPKRGASAGVWSVTMKDSYFKVTNVHIATMLPTGNYLGTQLISAGPDTNGKLVLKWVFNVSGTPTDLPASGQFIVSFSAAETNMGS